MAVGSTDLKHFLNLFLRFANQESHVSSNECTATPEEDALSSNESAEELAVAVIEGSEAGPSVISETSPETTRKKIRCKDTPTSSVEKVLNYLQLNKQSIQSADDIDLICMGYAKTMTKIYTTTADIN